MGHWKKLMDKELLGAWDLDGRDVTVTILDVTGGELSAGGGRAKKDKRPIATLQGTTKKLVLNATNCKTIEQLAGSPMTEKWKGLRVTLFPTTTQMGGETKECIRIRPYPPKDNGRARNGNGKGRDTAPAASDAPPSASAESADVPCDTCGVAPCACEATAQEPADAS